jgi:hypothetical protein
MNITILKVLAGIVICGLVVLFLKEGTLRLLILSVLFVLALIYVLTINHLGEVPDFLYFLV